VKGVVGMGSRFIDVRKLVALDVLLHGRPFILAEFGFGTAFLFVLGFQQVVVGLGGFYVSLTVGLYLLFTGVNYLPLLVYAIIISRSNSAEDEAESELQDKSKYNKQQFLVFVPLLVFILGVKQELDRHRQLLH
jgi:membrane protein implicated in regulation of membrane protease activity